MPATSSNPDPLQDQQRFETRSEGLDQAFVFKRLSNRDRQKVDDLIWDYCGGKRAQVTDYSAVVYEACANLQVAMTSPDPLAYSFIDLYDADQDVMKLFNDFRDWRDSFRAAARGRAGAAGGAE